MRSRASGVVQRRHPADTRIEALRDALDGTALPRRVPALEDDDDFQLVSTTQSCSFTSSPWSRKSSSKYIRRSTSRPTRSPARRARPRAARRRFPSRALRRGCPVVRFVHKRLIGHLVIGKIPRSSITVSDDRLATPSAYKSILATRSLQARPLRPMGDQQGRNTSDPCTKPQRHTVVTRL